MLNDTKQQLDSLRQHEPSRLTQEELPLLRNRYRSGVRLDLGRLSDWEGEHVVPAACGGRGANRREP
jgi:hypothetical protein